MGFELTNRHRRYLGLDEVLPYWDRVELNDRVVLYFDGDIVRKMVEYTVFGAYHETDRYEMTAENRTILLPKTKRGKPQKLNYTATHSFSDKGVYFYFSDTRIVIGNYTTQTSFYEEDNAAKLSIEQWLDKWVNETNEQNLIDLRRFKDSKRIHQKYAEGDFFTFRVGRNKWGFGRIVLNIAERRKSEAFKQSNYGLASLMGKALYIAIYRKLSDSPEADIDELLRCGMLPTQAIMDNRIFYGEYRIIGNRAMLPEEWEPLISFSRTANPCVTYLQYGLICKTTDKIVFSKYLKKDMTCNYMFRNESIGFGIRHYSELEKIITEGIDNDSLLWENELRKNSHKKAKRDIFRRFGLDPDKSYAENLRIIEKTASSQTTSSSKSGLLSFIKQKFK